MARLSGIYSLCVKYENDPQIYMIQLKVKTADENKTKYNIELIDSFTSRYPSKEALFDVIEKSVRSHRRPVDIFIGYLHNKKVNKKDIIINDPFIAKVSNKFCSDKYEEEIYKKTDRDTQGMKSLFLDIMAMVRNKSGWETFRENSYLSKNVKHVFDQIDQYGIRIRDIEQKNYKDDEEKKKIQSEINQLYHKIESKLLTDYPTFRHFYIGLYGNLDVNKKETNNEEKEFTLDITEIAQKIENPILKDIYIAYDGNPSVIFEYILTAFVGDEAGIFLNKLSYNDQLIVFGSYDVFIEKCQQLWPDIFGSRRL